MKTIHGLEPCPQTVGYNSHGYWSTLKDIVEIVVIWFNVFADFGGFTAMFTSIGNLLSHISNMQKGIIAVVSLMLSGLAIIVITE